MHAHPSIRILQLEVEPGRPQSNMERILDGIQRARNDGIQLLLLPELSIPGILVGGLWESPVFVNECLQCGEKIKAASQGLTVAFGNVFATGKPELFNGIFFAEDGAWIVPRESDRQFVPLAACGVWRKRYLQGFFNNPSSLEHNPNRSPVIVETKYAGTLGVITGIVGGSATSPYYPVEPIGCDLLLSFDSLPFAHGRQEQIGRMFGLAARSHQTPLIHFGPTGTQDSGKTIFVFDNPPLAYNSDGQRITLPDPTSHLEIDITISPLGTDPPALGTDPAALGTDPERVAEIAAALLKGMRVMIGRLGIKKMVIGLSGGIDSAVSAALCAKVISPKNLVLVSMPGPYTSRKTRTLAHEIAANLEACFYEIEIDKSATALRTQIESLAEKDTNGAGDLIVDTGVFENIQARDRGRLLMAMAASLGGAVVCNTNKSELTIGYGTMYGDLIGWIAPLGDLWKGEVYALGRYINSHLYRREILPEDIFNIKPSAELSAAQSIDKGLGDPLHYPYHDALFRSWVEGRPRVTPVEMLEWYASGELEDKIGYAGSLREIFKEDADFKADLLRWWGAYRGLSVAKRLIAPPVIAVSGYPFGDTFPESQLGG